MNRSFPLNLHPAARFRQHAMHNVLRNARAVIQQQQPSSFADWIIAAASAGFVAVLAAQAFI